MGQRPPAGRGHVTLSRPQSVDDDAVHRDDADERQRTVETQAQPDVEVVEIVLLSLWERYTKVRDYLEVVQMR